MNKLVRRRSSTPPPSRSFAGAIPTQRQYDFPTLRSSRTRSSTAASPPLSSSRSVSPPPPEFPHNSAVTPPQSPPQSPHSPQSPSSSNNNRRLSSLSGSRRLIRTAKRLTITFTSAADQSSGAASSPPTSETNFNQPPSLLPHRCKVTRGRAVHPSLTTISYNSPPLSPCPCPSPQRATSPFSLSPPLSSTTSPSITPVVSPFVSPREPISASLPTLPLSNYIQSNTNSHNLQPPNGPRNRKSLPIPSGGGTNKLKNILGVDEGEISQAIKLVKEKPDQLQSRDIEPLRSREVEMTKKDKRKFFSKKSANTTSSEELEIGYFTNDRIEFNYINNNNNNLSKSCNNFSHYTPSDKSKLEKLNPAEEKRYLCVLDLKASSNAKWNFENPTLTKELSVLEI